MQTLTVDLGERSYPIHIGHKVIQADLLLPHIHGKQVMIVSNDTVAPLYLESLKAQLEAGNFSRDFSRVSTVILPDGEKYKDLEHINEIFNGLLTERHNRTTTLIALGGGVIGDMTGFAAACYQRGVEFIQIPTTLLSQVDSSVGGKTGVNHPLGKNMIGAFHQPQVVLADTDALSTLPERELSAGLAEVIKYGLIYDSAFFDWLEQNIDALMARDDQALIHAIYRSCEIKAEVVAQDEKELGIRAQLNLGHTFGHAIETAQGYGVWLHGEAVGTGMLMAAELSARIGWLSATDVSRLRNLLIKAGLPVVAPENMSAEKFISLMAVDKKVLDGNLRLVLLKSIGEACVTSDFDHQLLRQTLEAGVQLGQL